MSPISTTRTSTFSSSGRSGVRPRTPRFLAPTLFLEEEEALELAVTARAWQTTPSRMAGMEEGTLLAYLTDRRLAERLALELAPSAEDAPAADLADLLDDEETTDLHTPGPLETARAFSRVRPDPFTRVPKELSSLGL